MNLEELIGHELPDLSAIKQAAEVIRNKGIANVVVSLELKDHYG